MLMPDVNVLIYAHRQDEAVHEQYRDWLKKLVDGPEPFALSVLVAVGFIRIVTRAAGGASALSAGHARQHHLGGSALPIHTRPRQVLGSTVDERYRNESDTARSPSRPDPRAPGSEVGGARLLGCSREDVGAGYELNVDEPCRFDQAEQRIRHEPTGDAASPQADILFGRR